MITEVLVEPISYPDKVTPTSVFARNRYEEKVQASLTQDDQEEIASKSQAEWDAYANQLATYLNDRKTFSAYDRDMFCALLPLMNGGVVATSPVMANCLGTNTNVQTLGSTIQAKQILFYLIGYVTKDAVALQSSAAVIKHALTKAETWKSTAADAGSERRNGIYFLQIALNKLVGMSEIADTQAACVCLGIPSQFSTCRPTFVFAKAAMAAVKTRQNEDRGIHYRDEYVDEESESSDSDAPCDGDNDELYPREMQPYDLFASIAELGAEEGKGRSTHLQSGPEVQDVKGGWGTVPSVSYTDKQDGKRKVIFLPQDINYAWRGERLQHLCMVEYACFIEVVQKDALSFEEIRQVALGDVDAEGDNETKGEEEEENDNDGEEVEDDDGVAKSIAQRSGAQSALIKRKGARPKNTRYDFGTGHPLYSTHEQCMRSKHFIPGIAGGRPPDFCILDHAKDDIPFTKKQVTILNESALFYMTILSPWTLQQNPSHRIAGEMIPMDGTDYRAFTAFMGRLDGLCDGDATPLLFVKPSAVYRSMKQYITNLTVNLRTSEEARTEGIKWRNQSRKAWPDSRLKNRSPMHPKDLGCCDLKPYMQSKTAKTFRGLHDVSVESQGANSDDGLNHGFQTTDEDCSGVDRSLQQLQALTKPSLVTKKSIRALSNAKNQQFFINHSVRNFQQLLGGAEHCPVVNDIAVQSIVYQSHSMSPVYDAHIITSSKTRKKVPMMTTPTNPNSYSVERCKDVSTLLSDKTYVSESSK
jgi:hypothetical protein